MFGVKSIVCNILQEKNNEANKVNITNIKQSKTNHSFITFFVQSTSLRAQNTISKEHQSLSEYLWRSMSFGVKPT